MGELSIQEAMQQFLKNSRLKYGMQAVQIEEVWAELMGQTIAKYTDSIKIIGSKLFITTAVAPLKNELLYQRDIIVERVNESFGEKIITEVIIQ